MNLENPKDRGAWWAAIYGVAQSRTQLMQLSNSSLNLRVFIYLISFNLLENVLLLKL